MPIKRIAHIGETTAGIKENTKNGVLLKFMAKVLPTFLFSLFPAIHIFQLVSIWHKAVSGLCLSHRVSSTNQAWVVGSWENEGTL